MTVEELITESSTDGRVCPQPKIWNELWNILPNRQRIGHEWDPPLPLILAAWWHSSDDKKRERFQLHLCWADKHGALETVAALIANMKPEDWHTER